MSGYNFSKKPVEVPQVETKHRRIKTKIPVPESIPLLEGLEKIEARSMHGQLPVIWHSAAGFNVYDRYGNCWIDFTSTIFVANAGHANSRVVSSISEKLDQKLLHTYTFVNEDRIRFIKKLVEISPPSFEKAFLLSSGTEAVECAIKLIRMYGQRKRKSKMGIVSHLGCMHGRTMGTEMLKGPGESSDWIGFTDPNMHRLPFPYPWSEDADDEKSWEKRFEKDMDLLESSGVRIEDIAGFIMESYQGWGAVFYPKAYIKALARYAKENDIVICFDEIQSGFGRTGKLYAFEHYDVEPDLVCIGKGVSSSLPLSAVLGKSEILDLPAFGSMSSTHSGNPVCCAAGLANIEAIESENLVEESARKGELLHSRLNELKAEFPDRISHIMGKGLVAAIILKDSKNGTPKNVFGGMVSERAMQKGLLLVHTGRESIKIGPPLIITDDALQEGLNVLRESFREVSG